MRQEQLYNGQTAAERKRQSGPGMVDGDTMEGALIWVLRALAIILVLLSILGTFYGVRGKDAPLSMPVQIALDIIKTPAMLILAILGQALLSVIQWGSRQRAMKRHPNWWILYFGALALSVWWNWQAYGDPMIALGVPWLLALGVIIGGDVLPEWAIIND